MAMCAAQFWKGKERKYNNTNKWYLRRIVQYTPAITNNANIKYRITNQIIYE